MHDSPSQAFRKKKDSSAHVAAKLVHDGLAEGMISAGNTGAVMAVARFGLGTLSSVDRPALAAPFPTSRGGTAVLLDVGANVDSKPAHLVQFAVMGEIYYRAIFGTRRPKVALLSIGEEEMKGNELTREAYSRLKHSPLNFVGNVEGREIFGGSVDVIVCDGFIGNVALKISEGVAQRYRCAAQGCLAEHAEFAGGIRAVEKGLPEFPEKDRLLGVWWGSAARECAALARDRAWQFEPPCDQERRTRSCGDGARQGQRENRE